MAIPVETGGLQDALNTVAVVPFDIDQPRATGRGAAPSGSSLAAAASNLINAIAQGSTDAGALQQDRQDNRSDDGSDLGSSSFTYTAATSVSANGEHHGWFASTPYHISNRYYDADITLKATKDALTSSSREETPSASSVLSQAYPAYIVVVDRSRSLEHHRRLAATLDSRIASGFDADISIVAGVSLISSSHPQLVTALDDEPSSSHRSSSQGSTAAKTSDLVSLYADHGWEFIAIDELDADDMDNGREPGDEDDDDRFSDEDREDDKDGIERIREALMNHMWNGLVRKDQASSLSRGNPSLLSSADLVAKDGLYQSFSDTRPAESADDETEQDNENGVSKRESETASSRPRLTNAEDASDMNGTFPTLGLDRHVEASNLDEQLAKLFLSTQNGDRPGDFAELEAFLESEDPSWPGPPAHSSNDPTQTFDDDFDDFLPFQSAPSIATPPAPQHDSLDAEEDLPSMDDVSQMQSPLFGANAAAHLEGGPLGMGSQPSGAADGDLASQLQQLQWHAQRVRNIPDADQRRKEAALVALAFSMQWSNADDEQGGADAGGMTF
ncbi:hypothetical protein PHSY_006167 [Pseudozyma hubeiensis SY62]|uniref:Uncharacterized protein n=1 Tax=Pseudozyma hubeiensis (strain SY62) TaxID=1305764 RepID=R9PAZ0_PSEHS|nr:hypothetical protein PHSY_006167 [Pseudozyma hubeiensis SY62]GAC98573.1 hypothetical protein PHSY_006167 [Pseudozyma hubeiensis SY62]